jgi:hypothetical protein
MFKNSSVYEGTLVKMFREPGEEPNPAANVLVFSGMHRGWV